MKESEDVCELLLTLFLLLSLVSPAAVLVMLLLLASFLPHELEPHPRPVLIDQSRYTERLLSIPDPSYGYESVFLDVFERFGR
jgi:hypothetical protein